jgi:hypothetical protein
MLLCKLLLLLLKNAMLLCRSNSMPMFAFAATAAAARLSHLPIEGIDKATCSTLVMLSLPQHPLCTQLLLLLLLWLQTHNVHTSRWIGLSGNRS